MAMMTQNMAPVYDGAGNLMGYINVPMQISYARIINGIIMMYDRNDIQMGSAAFDSTVASNLGFTPTNKQTNTTNSTPLISTGIMTGGTMPVIQSSGDVVSVPEISNFRGDVGGRDTLCADKRYVLRNIRTEVRDNNCVLVADIYENCCNPYSMPSYVGRAIIGRAKSTRITRKCNNGRGTQTVTVKYFDELDNIGTILDWETGNSANISIYSNWGECDTTIPTFLGPYFNRILQNPSQFLSNPADENWMAYRSYPNAVLAGIVLPEGNGICNTNATDCITPDERRPEPPQKVCLTVNNLSTAKLIDGGIVSIGNKNITGYSVNVYGTNSVEQYLNRNVGTRFYQNRETTSTEPLNLGEFGRPCEKGLIKTITPVNIEVYPVIEVCFTIDSTTGIVLGMAAVTTGDTFDGNEILGITTRVSDEITVQYDETADCCGTLVWPADYRGDTVILGGNGGGTVNTGLGVLRPNARFGGNTSTPTIAGMPPINTLYLNYNLSNIQTVRLTSCGCEEVDIADIWCYYNATPIKLWKKANVDDKTTHVSPIRTIADANCIDTRVYHPFDRKKDIFQSYKKDKTRGLFNGSQSLDCYITSSVTSSTSNQYYYAVTDCQNCDGDPYFAVAYGHVEGSGSLYLNGDDTLKKTPTDAIYSQYQLLCTDNESPNSNGGNWLPQKFTFVSESVTVESDDVYVINFYRTGLSDKLDPGNFEIRLAYLSGSFYANAVHTGSNVKVGSPFVMQLIDDSDDFSQAFSCHDQSRNRYAIVSGSLQGGRVQNAAINTYGWVYPALGTIVLHPKRLNELLGFNTVTGSNIGGDNAYKLFTAISGAASPTIGRSDSYKMLARSVTYKTTQNYSVRIYGSQANYSNNPTFVTGSKNRIFEKCLIENPLTYVTSVGLYNENLELLAVGKLTKPLRKDFDTDLLIKIRLNW